MPKSPPITNESFHWICQQVAAGKSLREALRKKGMPGMHKFYDYVEGEPGRAEQYARARQRGMELHIDGIIDLADSATPENAHVVRIQVDTRKWIASKLLPRVYGDRQQLDINVELPDLGERLRTAKRRAMEAASGRVIEGTVSLTPALTTIPTVTNDADYEALPSGATFLDPEGVEREKP